MDLITIVDSLYRRGFYDGAANHDKAAVQVIAVMEELGEVGRICRRSAQGKPFNTDKAIEEAVDTVIASVCLLATLAGHEQVEARIMTKLADDECRGFLHQLGPLRKDSLRSEE